MQKRYIPTRDVIENLGVIMEKMDVPPVHARIFILLLMANPPYMSFEEIQEHLLVSKSSVSKYLNIMLEQGTLDYRTFSGDRKRYFYLNHGKLLNKIYSGASRFSLISDLMKKCLIERQSAVSEKENEQLKEMTEFFSFLGEGLAKLVKEYQEQKTIKTGND